MVVDTFDVDPSRVEPLHGPRRGLGVGFAVGLRWKATVGVLGVLDEGDRARHAPAAADPGVDQRLQRRGRVIDVAGSTVTGEVVAPVGILVAGNPTSRARNSVVGSRVPRGTQRKDRERRDVEQTPERAVAGAVDCGNEAGS